MLRVGGLRGSREGDEFRIKCDQGDWVVISPLVWSPPDSDRVFCLQEVVGSQLIYLDYISGDFSRVNKP